MAISGIFILSELKGALGERVHEMQLRFDPKLAAMNRPHITLAGSSGVGPLPPTVPVHLLRERLAPIAASTPPLELEFMRPHHFMQTNIVSFPLDPHGPLRELHDRIATCGLPFTPARFPFTPHVTIHFYPELTGPKLRELLHLRLPDPARLDCLQCYFTQDPQPARKMLELPLTGRQRS